MFGGGQSDRLDGEAGDDTLAVSKDDVAFGGSGDDWFLFNTEELEFGTQVIRDFDGVSLNAGDDEDLLVFSTGKETGAFAYIGDAAFSASGNSEARHAGGTEVQVDTDGNGDAEFVFQMNGLSQAGQLTATDFLWL